MNTPRVLNVRTCTTEDTIDAVPIWRGTPWGNPFKMSGHTSRADAIARFEKYLSEHPEIIEAARRELRGKDLICYCAPRACHGDVLLRIANS
jgi:hypothetical protein